MTDQLTDLIDVVRYGWMHSPDAGCGCATCQTAWRTATLPKAIRALYPQLPEVPHQFLPSDPHGGEIGAVLSNVQNLKDHNRQISKQKRKGQTLTYCRSCGILHVNEHSLGDLPVCRNCHQHWFYCDHCHQIRHQAHHRVIYNGELWCGQCAKEEALYKCRDCNTWYPKDDLVSVALNFEERLLVCNTCKERLARCSHCDDGLVHPAFSRRDPDGGYMCSACWEEEQGMMPYYYKPTRLHFNTFPYEGRANDSTLFMGCEFELSNKTSALGQDTLIHLVKERFGKHRFYGMHDGTIERATGNPGVEIVSHPFTWQDYRSNITTWDDFLLYIRSKGWRANLPGVGLHIHTTKSAWTTYQLYRLLRLIYDNQDLVCTIAQRQPTEYCRMSREDEIAIAAVCKAKKNRNRDHYSAVNLNTSNGHSSKTIEFRMFQGTLEPLFFHKNVEFVKACYEYTREFAKPNGAQFVQYIHDNRRIYPCLHEFLNHRLSLTTNKKRRR